jgi:tetratricopeptide (TPR) repeat protein
MRNDAATSAYHRAIAIDPDNLAAQAALRELEPTASGRIERRVTRHPTDDELWGDLGDDQLMRGLRDAALRSYLNALGLDPADSEWQTRVMELEGAAYLISAVDPLLPDSDTDDERIGDRADAWRVAGYTEESCAMYARALALDPSDEEWTGRNATCTGEAAVAVAPLTAAVTPGIDPVPTAPTLTGAVTAGLVGAGPASTPDEIMALHARINGNAALLSELGLAYARSGDVDHAKESLWAALLLDPTDAEAFAGYLVVSGQTRLAALTRLAEALPTHDEVWGDLGDEQVGLAHLDLALAAYKKALACDPDDAEWLAKVALLDRYR